jgi:hypothetical protein
VLARLERSEDSFLLADVNGKVVASSDVNRLTGYQRHVGAYAQWPSEVSDMGIGEDIIRVQAEEAYKKGLKVLTLSVLQVTSVLFASTRNFLVQCGWTLKKLFKEDRRIDETIMTKWLE